MIVDLFRAAGAICAGLAKFAIVTGLLLSPYACESLLDMYLPENTEPPTYATDTTNFTLEERIQWCKKHQQ